MVQFAGQCSKKLITFTFTSRHVFVVVGFVYECR